MSPRAELHELVETIPDGQVEQAKKLLAGLCAPSGPVPQPGSIEELAAQLAADIPDEAWESLPEDLTDHLDHYIHGTPKR